MLLIFLLVILIEKASSFGTECNANFCQSHKCNPVINSCQENYVLIKNSTLCGCCHSCLKLGQIDENCITNALQNIPPMVCGRQLICKDATPQSRCVKDGSKCLQQRSRDSLERDAKTNFNLIPECDDLGDYNSYQCFRNSRCFCVDTQGKRIFGDFLYSQRHQVNCACSRDLVDIGTFISATAFIDQKYPQCQSDGNYQIYQETATHAYCVDASIDGGRSLRAGPLVKKNAERLPCYKKYHKDYPCWSHLERRRNQLKRLESDFEYVIGYPLPECDFDGTYKPRQCDENSCYCVNKSGEKFGRKMTIERSSPRVNEMRCNCIRDQDLVRNAPEMENLPKYECDHLGNYEKIQCHDDTCFCVDLEGFPVNSQRFNITLKNQIKCDNPNY